jgi:signal transduction histidine kinase
MKKAMDIRTRMLLAALAPVVLISTLLAVFFMLARFDDLELSHAQRTRALARQLALASEYGLFSANHAQLQALVVGALQEPDVRWIGVYDNQGQKLVGAGYENGNSQLNFNANEAHVFDVPRGLDWLAQPVLVSGIKLDDLYEGVAAPQSIKPQQLGQVQLVISRQSLETRRRDMLLLGGLIGALGLGFGLVLAWYLSRGVLRPIARVIRLIERIGHGDFAQAQAEAALSRADDPLQDLQKNLYRTAGRLALARDELQQQVMLATQSLREKKEEAEQANLAKSRFLAVASHDLRQPMHALGLFVTRLAQLTHDAQTRQVVSQLQVSVRAMQTLLDGLLDISRLDARTMPVQRRAFAIAGLFEQLQRDMAHMALEKNLTLHIRPSALWVMSDAALIYRILLNLTANALRYTHSGSVLVNARLSGSGKQVLLQVWDSGIGIAPEHQQRVFEEFYQIATASGDRARGHGLGLNIVQRTAQLLGHPLLLRSDLGCGTRFTLSLPRTVVGPALPMSAPEYTATDDLLHVHVLVIEDDDLVRAALLALLEGWGMQVHEANGLAQAQQQLAAGCAPALIISDYRLQETLNGVEVIASLRAQLSQDIPACLVSGETDAGLTQLAQCAGLTLLHKPVQPAKLRSLLHRLLQQQRPA